MSNKNIDLLIKKIKAATGLTQEEIAEEIRYSRAHFSVMKKEEPDQLYDLLESTYDKHLTKKPEIEDEFQKAVLASIRVLIEEVAVLKAKSEGVKDVNKVIKQLAKRANLEFDDL